MRGWRTGDYAIECSIVELRWRDDASQEIAYGSNKRIGVHHLHGIDTARIAITQIISGKGQLAIT